MDRDVVELILVCAGAIFAIAVVVSTAIDAAQWLAGRRARRGDRDGPPGPPDAR